MSAAVLSVRKLSVFLRDGRAEHKVVDGVSFDLAAGEVLVEVKVSAVNPTDGAPVIPINLISRDGLHWILEKTIENYTGFAPLGTVLVAMLGIGVAEKSGLIGTGLRLMVHAAPRRLLSPPRRNIRALEADGVI